MALPAVSIAIGCPSRVHFPAPLGSAGISRFIATTGTLTPVLVLKPLEQVSLVHVPELPDIPSPTTPCAPVFRLCFGSGRLGHRFTLGANGGSSDFAHHMQARQSHQAESSLCRHVLLNAAFLRTIRSLSVALHEPSLTHSYFQLQAGSSAREGLSPSCSGTLPSAHISVLRTSEWRPRTKRFLIPSGEACLLRNTPLPARPLSVTETCDI